MPVDVVRFGLGRQGRRHQEEDGVVVLGLPGKNWLEMMYELLRDVWVQHRAVVVVRAATGRRLRGVGRRLVELERGDDKGGRAGRGRERARADGD